MENGGSNMKTYLEYIWIDGTEPTRKLRAKTKVIGGSIRHIDIPVWGFDGSSTNQADGSDSDCVLVPAHYVKDPFRVCSDDEEAWLVLCEVETPDGKPHETNTRRALTDSMITYNRTDCWVGFEQEYTLFKDGRPLGWPEGGYPPPQGPFYCGVGADEVYGRDIAEEHLFACHYSGLEVCGVNAEVMPGQWEYQVGTGGLMEMSDDLWLSRYILYRVAEKHGVTVTLHPKPVQGDWNGAGLHTNFSTAEMRADGGYEAAIYPAMEKLERNVESHIAVYGHNNEMRLTGLHETCDINTFKWGVSDRGASIRIPWQVAKQNKGYFEDRRPAANADPYQISEILLETITNG
tara:strand:+ start:5688 stop:6731 length:1044 start_codon:yes stop_codon:yes gene_type:complete